METLRHFFSKTDETSTLKCFSARDIAEILTPEICLEALKAAYFNLADDPGCEPKTLGVMGEGSSFHIKAGLYPKTRDVFAAKLNANFPGNVEEGLPTIQGLLVLIDARNGTPLAIMDSSELTAIRTAATAALAASYGANPKSRAMTIIGAGFQASYVLDAFQALFPLEKVFVSDADTKKACAFANANELTAISEPHKATLQSDIIVTCTTATKPVLRADMVALGTFVAGVGADNKIKNEIDPELFGRANVFVDDLEKCAGEGDLQQALAAKAIHLNDIKGDLNQLMTGKVKARGAGDEIILFDSVGNGLQDVAAARAIFLKAF